MRLLHQTTIEIVANQCKDEDFTKATVSRKQVISHCWCEILKFKATNQPHPKMFIDDDEILGNYLSYVKHQADKIGCNLNVENLMKYDLLYIGFCNGFHPIVNDYFGREYLFSDAVSLYLKGLNIFPYVYGEEWRKYVPIENLKEVKRIVDKTLSGEKEIERED